MRLPADRRLLDLLLIDLLAAASAGALHSLGFADTALWPLPLLALAWLVGRAAAVGAGRAAALGWTFGTCWLACGTWWLYISMHRYGGLPAPLAAAAVLALAAFLSLYLALALAVFARWRRHRPALAALQFAACWLLAELARGVLFTGFPWVASGYAQVDGPLAPLAPWVGVYGIGAVSAFAIAWPTLALRRSRRRGLRRFGPAVAVALAAALLWIAGPASFTQPGATLAVTLLQTNVPQDEKFSLAQMPQTLAWLQQQLLAARGQLVIAPETAIPLLPDELGPDYLLPLKARFQSGERAALIGLPLFIDDHGVQGYTNSVAGLSRGSAAAADGYYRYDKHHLVPFGEFIPYGFRWFTEAMHIPLGDFTRGPLVAPSFIVDSGSARPERVAPNICYEDLFGEDLGARFADAATAPTLFANMSNIGWFGDTVAIRQHLQISRLRALEFQRPMLRATNTGATVIIDHRGRVTGRLAPFTRGVLEGQVQGRSGLTPYARWVSAAGLGPLLIAALAVLGACAAWPSPRRPRLADRAGS